MKARATTEDKPVLDRESFQQLLAAAYVLQEQNDRQSAPNTRPDYNQALAEFVEIQSLIQSHQIDLQAAASLICRRAQEFTNADGAAIGILKDDELTYAAASGIAADEVGNRIGAAASLPAHCLITGQIIQSMDALKDRRLLAQLCREHGIEAFIAVPARHEGRVAGTLELHFSKKNAFEEQDVRTCQLMAGLWSQAITGSAELEWKQTLAIERANMIEALERIKPQLERIASDPPAIVEVPVPAPLAPVQGAEKEEQAAIEDTKEESAAVACQGCGHQLSADEFFCGICGTARAIESPSSGDLQSKWASLWHLKQAADIRKHAAEAAEELESGPADVAMSSEEESQVEISEPDAAELAVQPAIVAQAPSAWNSSSNAQQWFNSLQAQRKRSWFVEHRANFYLATAAVLLLVVIAGWGWQSAANVNSSGATRGHRNAAPQLTLFEKALVELGLAVPPVSPVYKGNPDTKVWEDERTALYYCPGADLYGKTERGKFSSQRDAQSDQFEPAFRRPCD